MFRALAVFCVALSLSASAFGQVIYQPVQSQFPVGSGDQHYYYGGTNPRVYLWAHSGCSGYAYTLNLHHFDGGNSFGQPSPMYDRTPVYTDCIPYRDVAPLGYTAVDAQNQANANAARYFRKADLLASAIPTLDGGWIVPPTPATVSVMPMAARAPSAMPGHGQIIIIPKNLLDRRLKDFTTPPGKVASIQE